MVQCHRGGQGACACGYRWLTTAYSATGAEGARVIILTRLQTITAARNIKK